MYAAAHGANVLSSIPGPDTTTPYDKSQATGRLCIAVIAMYERPFYRLPVRIDQHVVRPVCAAALREYPRIGLTIITAAGKFGLRRSGRCDR